ncbi:hypothetical protein JTE90_015365 [Oedothorax gibbosus]|uniref:Chitin-binding type-2 domain-containing protein n=1 Tax=Oedothorax gibbosus TaxID=931172 RepID=A0AAV6U2X5_9ARAC|nr:hypothetical protein JTE90_015365 [Oedothorax gibbosus]
MKTRCLPLTVFSVILLVWCATENEANSHKLVKRQFPSRGSFPLSRSRQFPPPEELEEYSEEEEDVSSEERSSPPAFRGRQPQPPSEEEYDYVFTEAPKVTTPAAPQRTTARSRFGTSPSTRSPVSAITRDSQRFAARPRFGSSAPTPAPRTAATPAQSQRLDVVATILNQPSPPRSRSIALSSRTGNENSKPKEPVVPDSRRITNSSSSSTRVRTRGRLRQRSSTTSTTTTTTTQQPSEEYYYYYEDDEAPKNQQPIATTTSTTTTTTTPRPRSSLTSFGRSRPSSSRSKSTSKPAVLKFDPDSQFVPPPDEVVPLGQASSSTKRFTTSSTMSPEESGGIPPHLRSKYRPRADGRFIDFLRDPNRPRELKGFDLTDYPFYIVVPDDITFDCDDKKDGYYASIPHGCQLFHYCFAGHRYDFLCANYTLYDQTTFTCRFANHVDCDASAKYYNRNDDLWKETTTTTTTTTTRPPRRRRPPARDEDYEEDYYEDDYEDEEEEERRRRPYNRRRNRNNRKNRRKQNRDKDRDEGDKDKEDKVKEDKAKEDRAKEDKEKKK